MASSEHLLDSDVLRKGLYYIGVDHERQGSWSEKRKEAFFHKHFGSDSHVIGAIWRDLCGTAIRKAQLLEEDKTEMGFIRFIMAMYFLWTYPKNVELMVSQFGFRVCERLLQGKELWYWPKKIAALKKMMILWDASLDDVHSAHIPLSVDGINFAAWEEKHPTLNKNPKNYDHKHNCCGYKYEIAAEIYRSKIAWIRGPIRAGRNDKEIFQDENGLKDKLGDGPGKMAVAHEVSQSCLRGSCSYCSIPNGQWLSSF